MTRTMNIRGRILKNWKLATSLALFASLLAFSSFSFSQNLVTNPGFENGTTGWSLDEDASAQFTESSGRSGNRLTHWSSSASYTAETTQTVSGLSAGTYRLSLYTVGGATTGAWLWAFCDGQSFTSTIPSSPWGSWAEVVVDNIQVSGGGSCTLGITTEDSEWSSFDDVAFEQVSGGGDDITVRASGTDGDESISLQVGGSTVETWTLSTSMQNYEASTELDGEIRVEFTNDNGSRDVRVDYIEVNGAVRQAEDQAENTGVWDGSCGGGSHSELLHCNGYISFGDVVVIDDPSVIVIEEGTGFCSVDGSVDSNHAGYTGSGFANTNNVTGAGVDWKVEVPSSGNYILEWRYASSSSRPGNVLINGSSQAIVDFPSTGAWDSWTSVSANVALSAGENTIRLQGTTSAGLGNIDSLSVTGNSPQAVSCGDSSDSCGDDNSNSRSSCSGDPAVCLLGGGVGNYRVSMKFDASYSGEIEVFAESRRRMFTSPQQSSSADRCVTVLVDVRDPEGQPLQDQSDRGTSGLNLRIAQGTPGLSTLTFDPISSPTTLFIAGDSTVADQRPQLWTGPEGRYSGWGQLIPAHFGGDIEVANYSDSGEGTQAFRTDGGSLWSMINSRLKSGDWVMIQLGHNDKTTSASLYRSRITNMVIAIRDKGANPILITPMIRNNGDPLEWQHVWGDLNIRNELIGIANTHNVPLVDLMKLTSEWVDRIGRSTAQTYFVGSDKTHSNEIGAELFAQMIVDEIRRQNIGTINYLR